MSDIVRNSILKAVNENTAFTPRTEEEKIQIAVKARELFLYMCVMHGEDIAVSETVDYIGEAYGYTDIQNQGIDEESLNLIRDAVKKFSVSGAYRESDDLKKTLTVLNLKGDFH